MSQNNRSAGDLINKINTRHKFADWVRQRQAAQLGLANPIKLSGGNTALNTSAAYSLVVEGAQYTTASEQASYLAEVDALVATSVPSEPLNVVATAGNGEATITFDTPNSNGGEAIVSYTVVSDPEGLTATGTSSPITFAGLANGETYTFTVYATNSVGNGASSTASAAITPTGGTLTTQQFTTLGSSAWLSPTIRTVIEYLIVGGGGGGGGGYDTGGGGGGGGGMVLTGTFTGSATTFYSVEVGAGGTASTNSYPSAPQETAGGDGESSSFHTITALGGGGGRGSRTQTGGSGLGGAAQTAVASARGGNGGGSVGGGGGGGGASGAGGNKSGLTPGEGGSGISSSLSGTPVIYGYGGNGARGNTSTTGAAGIANRGNGGGGGGFSSGGARNGGAGGSGIVIIRYYAQP